MKTIYEDLHNKSKIVVTNNSKYFVIEINSKKYSFNVDYLDEMLYAWFCELIGNNIVMIYSQAFKNGQENIKNRLKNILK